MNFVQKLQELFSQQDMCSCHKYKDIFNVHFQVNNISRQFKENKTRS